MRRRLVRPTTVAAVGVLALASASACTAGSAANVGARGTTSGGAAGTTPGPTPTAPTPTRHRQPLVVGAVFDHTTLDPTRQFDRSGAMLTHALYQTLTTPRPRRPDEGRARDGRVHPLARGPVADLAPAQGPRLLRRHARHDRRRPLHPRARQGAVRPGGLDHRHDLGDQGRQPHLHAHLDRGRTSPSPRSSPTRRSASSTRRRSRPTAAPSAPATGQRLPLAALRGLGSLRHRERARHLRGPARGQPAVGRAGAGVPPGRGAQPRPRASSSPRSRSGGVDVVLDLSPSQADAVEGRRPRRLGGHGHDDALEHARLPRPRAQQGPQPVDRQPRLRRGRAPRPRPRTR